MKIEMILTLISPTGERWSINPAPMSPVAWVAWLETLPLGREAVAPLIMLWSNRTLPLKGKSILAHTKEGWQAILSNP